MSPKGELLIGGRSIRAAGKEFFGLDPATGKPLQPAFATARHEHVDQACALAAEAFRPYRETTLEQRATFLEKIARNVLDLGDELIARATAETGLPRGRIEGERNRTIGQLQLFASVVRDGGFLDARIDPQIPERKPARRPDIRQQHIGLGPVAVFGASNFPLAFSVAGGDTASALAAGCPVIVKAHSAHPGTSELVGRAIQSAVRHSSLHEGVFSLLFGSGRDIGSALVADPRIKAGGFTGSRAGGLALLKIAQSRPEPIPFYAEMSSINPVVLLRSALRNNAESIAASFVASLTLGAGQFCTNPGLVLAIDSPELDTFVSAATRALAATPAALMLTADIHAAYERRVQQLTAHPRVSIVAQGGAGGVCRGQAALFTTHARDFRKHAELSEEVFGAAGLLVRCQDIVELHSVLEELEGQLTVSVHLSDDDLDDARRLLPILEVKAGRLLINGFGTGVEVGHAIVHGGPFPATSDARTTSVGSLAIRRFLRPVAYQDFPQALLPDSLKDANPLHIRRLVNGAPEAPPH